MQKTVYLDYAATTPAAPEVIDAMQECLGLEGRFGNPASRSHVFGWQAEERVEHARQQVAQLIHADPREIVWTSGATEANNLALKGLIEARRAASPDAPLHLITSRIEHKAVLDTCGWLEQQGVELSYIAPERSGDVAIERVLDAIRPHTCAVSLMHANNETGSVNDIAALGEACRARGVLLHVDAAQSLAKIPVDVKVLNVDLLSMSAHKMYGPKGIGALYVRRHPDVRIAAQMHGGGHERGMRSGTLATHQIVGFGRAAALAEAYLDADSAHLQALRQHFLDAVLPLTQVSLNGTAPVQLPGTVNLSFDGIDSEMFAIQLRELAISSGSACMSASMAPSYVLQAMGLSDEEAHNAFRFSFGRYTREQDIQFAAQRVRQVLAAATAAQAM